MTNHRRLIVMGAFIALLAWASRAALLTDMTRIGMISALAYVLLLISVIALAVGAVRVYFGKSGRVSFALHIAFVLAGGALMQFLLVVPIVVSAGVAVGALISSFKAQSGPADVSLDAGSEQV